MKKLLKLLVPLAIVTIPVSIVACSTGDGLKAIPQDYLKIEGNVLKGIRDVYDDKEFLEKEGYKKLTIGENVSRIQDSSFQCNGRDDPDGALAIKKVDFQSNKCTCTKFGDSSFAGCTSLETVVFTPGYLAEDVNLFMACSKLKTFDLSNITAQIENVRDDYLIATDYFPSNGKIIMKSKQDNVKPFADYLYGKLSSKGWTIVKK